MRHAIRSSDTDTLAAPGREIHRRDSLAWCATDVLFAEEPQERVATGGGAGWFVDTNGETPMLRFVREIGDRVEAAYAVVFPKNGKPHVVEPKRRELSLGQRGMFRVLRTASEALTRSGLPWCRGGFNHVELADPDGEGGLVYFLRAKPSRDAVADWRASPHQLFLRALTLGRGP